MHINHYLLDYVKQQTLQPSILTDLIEWRHCVYDWSLQGLHPQGGHLDPAIDAKEEIFFQTDVTEVSGKCGLYFFFKEKSAPTICDWMR